LTFYVHRGIVGTLPISVLSSSVTFSPLPASLFSAHFIFFFTDTATSNIYTLSLHDALPIYVRLLSFNSTFTESESRCPRRFTSRSEEHTSELQSRFDLVCRLLLEKKNQYKLSLASDDNPVERDDKPDDKNIEWFVALL